MALQIINLPVGINKKALTAAAKEAFLFLSDDFEANLKFVSNKEIETLNSQFRGLAKATDVLSFKLDEQENGGDIAICLSVVKKEAREWQMSTQDVVCWLLVHGTLHLAGYDHINDSGRVKMETAEREILNKLGIVINR